MTSEHSVSVLPRGTRRRLPVPDSIDRIVLPATVLSETDRVMRRFGREHRECYVWWGGYFLANGTARIVSALYPEVFTHFGLIHLRRRELSALHERLRTVDLVLVAELHTHPPGAGGQNEVDAANAAATYPGFTSIVVPDFAFPQFSDPRDAYVYRYLAHSRWQQLNRAEIGELFLLTADAGTEEPIIAVRP